MYFFQIGLFHSAICIYSLSMSFYGSVAHFFLSLNDILLFVCITVVFFTPMERELGCFWLFTIRSKVAINICMLAFFFNWRITALRYWVGFCHTSTWINSRYKYVLSWISHLPRHPTLVSQSTRFELPESHSKFPFPSAHFRDEKTKASQPRSGRGKTGTQSHLASQPTLSLPCWGSDLQKHGF